MKRLLARHSPLLILAGLCIVLAVLSPDFRQQGNLQRVAYRTAVVGIIATGEILVIITAGIDLSVGSVAALAGVVACMTMKWLGAGEGTELVISVGDVVLGVMAGTFVGLLCGGVNGFLVSRGKIPPFIVTLGAMMVTRGLALLLSGAVSISGLPDSFKDLGGSRGWYVPVLITGVITIIFAILLAFTRFGRAIYATGGKRVAARLSGIPVDRVLLLVYALCGLLAGFAGVILAARTGIAQPTAAESYELDAIAACVIGGASLMGGEGMAIGALAGALIMNVLTNFCNLQGFDVHWQKVLIGALIIVLVYYDNFRKRRVGLLKED